MDKIIIKIESKYDGLTIKEYLKSCNVGRGKIENIRVNKSSFINGKYFNLETKLKEKDLLSFEFDEKIDYVIDDGKIDVVYEDDYILAINKPSGMLVHPDIKDKNNTLVNLVANYYQRHNISRNIRYLHRIDYETSGIVLFAKDFLTESIMNKMIENHEVEKYYLALVTGHFFKDKGVIKQNIGKDRHINSKMCVCSNGKEAITKYNVIKKFDRYSLVEFNLITGRTHQIRVHSSFYKCPLLGDVIYGGDLEYISRVALHSYKVVFNHPITNKNTILISNLPEEMEKLTK